MWVEKHRPRRIEEIMGQEEVKKRVKAFLKARTVPNLLLYGPRGTGKTSLALVIARSLYGDFWRENMLHVECADFIEHRKAWLKQRPHFSMFYDEYKSAIDIFNRAIKGYAGLPPMNADFRIVFLNNSDLLPANIQQSLRRMIEKYNRTCRFIFATTMPARIIPPIRSRCLPLHFKPLDRQIATSEDLSDLSEALKERGGERGGKRSVLQELLMRILSKEGFSVTEEALNAIEDYSRRACFGGGGADAGVAISIAEAASAVVSAQNSYVIDIDAVNSAVKDFISQRDVVRKLINLALTEDKKGLREIIKSINIKSSADILAEMHNELRVEVEKLQRMTTRRETFGGRVSVMREMGKAMDKEERVFADLFIRISDADFDIREAFNDMIHIEHMLLRIGESGGE